ncbi:MAG: TonB family protein [Endomicrobium sp.]|jgi:protein TonB|nr:TonB family protein [Endomicrobium sp.]
MNQVSDDQSVSELPIENTKKKIISSSINGLKENIVINKKNDLKEIIKNKPKKYENEINKQHLEKIVENKVESTSSFSDNSNIEMLKVPNSLTISSNGIGRQYSEVSFDRQDFKYFYYKDQITRKINKYWRWIESYERLEVIVYFKIYKDGTVSDIIVKKPSNNNEYDRNALDTIQRAAPFAELPEDYQGEFLGVFFEFKYRNE